MADNTTLDAGSGGDVIRTEDRTTYKTPVSLIDVGGTAGESLIGDFRVRMPVDVQAMPLGLLDSFGHMVTGSINNHVDIQWYRSDGSVGDLVTETNANGGTATATNGMATFSATTAASSQAKGVTAETTIYTAGAEVYCLFSAAFTGTGSGTSYQRIGLYDTNNGFFVGFEAATFNATVRKGGSDSSTAKGSFNVDTLVGGATSQFTRAGTPEAIDLTKINVFRIRFGWLGSASIKFEVLAPDGHWVLFHELKQPNNAAVPSINTADLPVTCDVNSGNSSAALSILTNCWCAGTTVDLKRLDATITDATLSNVARSVLSAYNGTNYTNIQATAAGNLKTSIQEISDGLDVGAGNAGTETQRVSISTDDVNLAAINTAVTATETNTDYGTVTGGGTETGALRVTIANNSTGTLTVDDGGSSLTVDGAVSTAGNAAHDAADSGNPVKIGAKATTSVAGLTLVGNADRTDLFAGSDGVLITRPHSSLEDIVTGNASNTDGASTQCIAAQGAGVKTYLTAIELANSSATDITCDIKDGTTIKWSMSVPANGGNKIVFTTPLGGTANTAWNFDGSTAATTLYCSMIGFKSKV